MKSTLLCLFLFLSYVASSQNLIPNPSFENYNTLPCSWITSANEFNTDMQNWTAPSDGTTDIFSTLVATSCYANCFSSNGSAVGSEAPHSGNVMSAILTYGNGCGFQPDYREYLQAHLTQPLVIGQSYYAEFYVSLGDNVDYASNNIGMYFSTSYTYNPTCFLLSFTPQINETSVINTQNGWTKISGTFTATTAAQYVIIGNFYSNGATTAQSMGGSSVNARYFVDDVNVSLAQPVSINGFNSICLGDSVALIAAGASTYAWADSVSPSTILSSDSVLMVNPSVTSTYLLYTPNDTLSFTVTVFDAAAFSLGADTTLCNGDILMLDAGTSNASYLWQDGSTGSNYTITSQGFYSVQLSFANGCTAVDSVVVNFSPCNVPNIAFASSDSSFCEKQCIDFFDLSSNNPTSWQWLFPNAQPDTSSLQNPTGICYNSYGNFTVTLIACNANGCDTLSISNFVNEYQNPTDSIWLSNDTLYSLPAVSYQWYELSAGLIAGATNSYYVIAQPGNYYCLVNDTIGCVATSNSILITAINELVTFNSSLSISPNPSNGTFVVKSLLNRNENAELVIYDVMGSEIYKTKITDSETHINLESANGFYFLQLKSDSGIYQTRICIQH